MKIVKNKTVIFFNGVWYTRFSYYVDGPQWFYGDSYTLALNQELLESEYQKERGEIGDAVDYNAKEMPSK
jgi:hypothetical protein